MDKDRMFFFSLVFQWLKVTHRNKNEQKFDLLGGERERYIVAVMAARLEKSTSFRCAAAKFSAKGGLEIRY